MNHQKLEIVSARENTEPKPKSLDTIVTEKFGALLESARKIETKLGGFLPDQRRKFHENLDAVAVAVEGCLVIMSERNFDKASSLIQNLSSIIGQVENFKTICDECAAKNPEFADVGQEIQESTKIVVEIKKVFEQEIERRAQIAKVMEQ